MLPFGGQGSNMAMEDAGALGFLFQGLDEGRPELIGERLVLFEKVRKNRASRIQVLSKVRGGREKVVEDEVRQYADKPTDRECFIHESFLTRVHSFPPRLRKSCSSYPYVAPRADSS